MAGPCIRDDSGIYYLKKVLPTEFKSRRKELASLGVETRGAYWVSLRTKDKREADSRYRKELADLELRFDAWRLVLADGPSELTHKESVALAGNDALVRLNLEDEEPLAARFPWKALQVTYENVHGYVLATQGLRQAQVVFEAWQQLSGARIWPVLLSKLAIGLGQEPVGPKLDLFRALNSALIRYRETLGWVRAPVIALEAGQGILTTEARRKVADRIAESQKHIWEALERRLQGDYTSHPILNAASVPALPAPIVPVRKQPNAEPDYQRWTFEDVIAKRENESANGLGKDTTPATIRKYRTLTNQFGLSRGNHLVAGITNQQVEAWRDTLRDDGGAAKTIRDKIFGLQSVLQWAQGYSNGQLYPNRLPTSNVAKPSKQRALRGERGHKLENARLILIKSRNETIPERRWIPWLLAYSGMRIDDALQLEKDDVEEVEGCFYIHARHDLSRNRTTKHKRSRRIPIHSDIQQEGFIEFVQSAPTGRLFMTSQSREGGQARMREWVKSIVDLPNKEPPLHGFRHLFQDLCKSANVRDDVTKSIMGHTGGDRMSGEYGGGPVWLKTLSDELRKIKPLLDDEGRTR